MTGWTMIGTDVYPWIEFAVLVATVLALPAVGEKLTKWWRGRRDRLAVLNHLTPERPLSPRLGPRRVRFLRRLTNILISVTLISDLSILLAGSWSSHYPALFAAQISTVLVGGLGFVFLLFLLQPVYRAQDLERERKRAESALLHDWT